MNILDQNQFEMKALLLGTKLSGLWLFTFQSLTMPPDLERTAAIIRMMGEVNQLHREMFPDFEHSLYGDDFINMIEGNEEQ